MCRAAYGTLVVDCSTCRVVDDDGLAECTCAQVNDNDNDTVLLGIVIAILVLVALRYAWKRWWKRQTVKPGTDQDIELTYQNQNNTDSAASIPLRL